MEKRSRFSLSLPTFCLIDLFHCSSSVGVKRYFAAGKSTFKAGSQLPCTALYLGWLLPRLLQPAILSAGCWPSSAKRRQWWETGGWEEEENQNIYIPCSVSSHISSSCWPTDPPGCSFCWVIDPLPGFQNTASSFCLSRVDRDFC